MITVSFLWNGKAQSTTRDFDYKLTCDVILPQLKIISEAPTCSTVDITDNCFFQKIKLTMFRTKKDVDKHVLDINSKLKSSSERNLKGYSIAKLYCGVRRKGFEK